MNESLFLGVKLVLSYIFHNRYNILCCQFITPEISWFITYFTFTISHIHYVNEKRSFFRYLLTKNISVQIKKILPGVQNKKIKNAWFLINQKTMTNVIPINCFNINVGINSLQENLWQIRAHQNLSWNQNYHHILQINYWRISLVIVQVKV